MDELNQFHVYVCMVIKQNSIKTEVSN
jgi:hypothetical protein